MNGIKSLALATRPRERLKNDGVAALSDDELIAIILRTGTKDFNAKELANKILIKINGINQFNNTSLTDLASIKGVGEVKAITLLAAIELGKRSLKISNNHLKINSDRIVYDLFKYDFINVYQEKFMALFLDTKKNLITSEIIFMGTVSSSTIHPREIFKTAMKNSASAIIVIHNHPTGDSTPSLADQNLTKNLINIGKIMGIPIIDHIIIGYHNYYSFLEAKRIDLDE
jgi:DNA repair protein RadC